MGETQFYKFVGLLQWKSGQSRLKGQSCNFLPGESLTLFDPWTKNYLINNALKNPKLSEV